MSKHVVVVASGETERRALPHLVSHLREAGITVDVRIPPRHRALRVDVVESIIKATWFASLHDPPAKFVVLIDVDRATTPVNAVSPLQEELSRRVSNVEATLHFAYAQQHLEAWYFADSENLRQWLGGRSLGSVDTSAPDAIQDPKRHLSGLLGNQVYTARTSEDIARALDPQTIEQRSPSFRGLVDAVRNGGDNAQSARGGRAKAKREEAAVQMPSSLDVRGAGGERSSG